MNAKIKKWVYRILKIIWIVIGIFLAIIVISLWIKTATFRGSGFSGIGAAIGLALLFIIGISIFLAYIGITLLFLLIKWIIKKFRRRK